jgi:hypothetical protein
VRRIAVVGALATVSVLVGGCHHGSKVVVPQGVVGEIAAHCAGPPAPSLPVLVCAREHGRVASQVVSYQKHLDHYRFSLPSGRYVISAQGSADPPRLVILHPGEHVIVNFPNSCD